MSYTLKLKDIVIGWCDFESRDPVTRLARGPFRPGLGFELVEPIFMLKPTDPHAADALDREARYRRARNTLALSLHDKDGAEVDTARIDIVRDEANDTQLVLEVSVVDRGFWKVR